MNRSYKLFGGHELSALRTYVEERIKAWAKVWVPDGVKIAVNCTPAAEADTSFYEHSLWQRLRDSEAFWIAYKADSDGDSKLGEVLAGEPVAGGEAQSFLVTRFSLAARVVSAALEELSLALLSFSGPVVSEATRDRTSFPPDVWTKGSAVVLVDARLGDAVRVFALSGELVMRILAGKLARPVSVELQSRPNAIASRPVRLLAVAGTAEVDVRAIGQLSVGDVVQLDTPIDQPIALVVDSKLRPAVCEARLGTRQGTKAVLLGAGN